MKKPFVSAILIKESLPTVKFQYTIFIPVDDSDRDRLDSRFRRNANLLGEGLIISWGYINQKKDYRYRTNLIDLFDTFEEAVSAGKKLLLDTFSPVTTEMITDSILYVDL